MKKQILKNQPHDSYLATKAISSGMVKLCHQKSLLHVWDSYLNPERQDDGTEAMNWGRALHEKFLLGDEAFDARFIITEKVDRRTKDGKAKWLEYEVEAERTGKTLIKPGEDHDHMQRMVDSLRNNNLVAARMEGTERELSCFVGDMKCRFDAVGGETATAIDVKTISEITRHNINASVARYGYHIQAAWYLRIAEALEIEIDYSQFCLIFVESKPPYDVCVTLLSNDSIQRGRDIVDRIYPEIQAAWETGIWPGFGGQEVVANIPLYAYTDDE